jgi:hypothetical protein
MTSRGNELRVCLKENIRAIKAKTPAIFAKGAADKSGTQSSGRAQ